MAGAERLFIFDMGGVVSRAADVVPLIAARVGIGVSDFLRLAGGNLAGLQTGSIDPPEFWRRFSRSSGIPVAEELWGCFFSPTLDREVVALIQGLRRRGRVVCGTNTVAPHYAVHDRLGDYECFDAVYASHLMGVAKPDPAFYLHILREEGAEPRDAFFVDDVERNVEAARRLGITAVVFTDEAALAGLLGPEER